MRQPPSTDTWVAFSSEPLSVDEVHAWAITPTCGAVVTFTGTVRDHAPGRDEVSSLEYEAFDEHVERCMADVVVAARAQWPIIGRVGILHRGGMLAVTDVAVVVVVSAPHRDAAFDAARYCIDTVKATAPIWKKETWSGGADWSAVAS